MTDVYTREVRSRIMAHVPGKNTKPEILVRKFLHRQGFRFRIHAKNLPGKPDITLPKYKTAIFINGCFWHGHANCKSFRPTKSNIAFWTKKIQSNIDRDKRNLEALSQLGWKIITIWECELCKENISHTLNNLVETIKQH